MVSMGAGSVMRRGVLLACCLQPVLAVAAPGALRAGFARQAITPDISNPEKPVWMAGFSQNRRARSVHDDLLASAVAVSNGTTTGVIISLDAVGLMKPDVDKIRLALRGALPIDFVVVSSTHTHAGPDVIGIWGPNLFETGADEGYIRMLVDRAVTAGRMAFQRLEPVRLLTAKVADAAADVVEDTRPPVVTDSDAHVFRFLGKTDSRTRGTIVSWANHPEVLWDANTSLTSDFVHYLRLGLETGLKGDDGRIQRPGLGGQAIYLSAAIGGLMTTHDSTAVRDPLSDQVIVAPSFAKARAVGYRLAEAVLDAVKSGQETEARTNLVRWSERSLNLPVANLKFLAASALGIIRRPLYEDKGASSTVGLLQLGDDWLAAVPGELYPELANGGVEAPVGNDLGLKIPSEQPVLRKAMSGRHNVIMGLANDQIGYIVPSSQWDARRPYTYGYTSAPYGEENSLGPQTAHLIHDALLELFAEAQGR